MQPIKFSAYRKFHLLQSKTKVWESTPEHLSHYRIIYILSGNGMFILNGEMKNYVQHGVIFLEPGHHPVFQENDGTEILVIAFDTYLSEDFQKKKAYSPDFADTYKQVENLCRTVRLNQGEALHNERDAQAVAYLISQISFEFINQPASFLKLIKSGIEMLVTIFVRNNFEYKKASKPIQEQTLAETIVAHLKNELHQNKTIRVAELLMRFSISEEVANLCMINQTGMSLRNFIFRYKADLFKSRALKVKVSELSRYA
jgi:hypothetical protein